MAKIKISFSSWVLLVGSALVLVAAMLLCIAAMFNELFGFPTALGIVILTILAVSVQRRGKQYSLLTEPYQIPFWLTLMFGTVIYWGTQLNFLPLLVAFLLAVVGNVLKNIKDFK